MDLGGGGANIKIYFFIYYIITEMNNENRRE